MVSQSDTPHAHFAGLAAVPSEMAHGANRHRLSLLDVSQNSPVVAASQSFAPQAQSAALAADPSVMVQYGPGRHCMAEASQKRPVVDVHLPDAPQTHGLSVGVAPCMPMSGQAGPVNMHRQALDQE